MVGVFHLPAPPRGFARPTATKEQPMPRPMTMAEKILAAHAGLDEVEPGQLIECDLDLVPVSYTHLDVYKRQALYSLV